MLRHWPAILGAVVAGALLLGVTAAAPALFLSSTGTDALERSIAESTRYRAGVTVALRDLRRDVLPGDEQPASTVEVRDAALREAVSGLPHLDDRVLSVLADPVQVDSAHVRPGRANPVRLVYRTGALDHIDEITGVGTGAWIQDVTADSLRVEPGDHIILETSGGETARIRVAGVYEALANAPPDPFWEPLSEEFRPPSVAAPLPPPFVLVDRPAIESLMDRLGHRGAEFQWEFPLSMRAPLDVSAAAGLADRFRDLSSTLLDVRSRYGRFFASRCRTCAVPAPIRLDFLSTLEDDVARARETVAGLRPSIELLAVVGLLTALVVLGAAGLYAVHRRRTEVRFLLARGLAPATLGGKAAVESAIAVVVGAAGGLGLAALVLGRFGPGDKLDPAGVAEAARTTAAVVPVALAVIAAVAAAAAVRESTATLGRSRLARIPWEVPVLAVAAFALYRVTQAGGVVADTASDVDRPSTWLLVFPVLFVGGVAGVAARAFRGLLSRARRRERTGGIPVYLALNRLAAARSLAIMLITASALAFGMFLYARTMAASVRETTTAKAHVFTGSDVAVPIDRQYEVPESFPWPATVTTSKLDAGRLVPVNETVDVLGIDVTTFERAAFWDDSFSDESLASLMRALEEPSPTALSVIVAGRAPEGSFLELGGVEIPYRVVARVDAFPGRFLDRTLLVVNRDTAGEVIEDAGGLSPITAAGAASNLWIKGDERAVAESLADLGFGPDDSFSAGSVLRNPGFVSVSRTFGFLEALGGLGALLVLVGTILYLQSRQRGRALAYALARRMGLRARSHYLAVVIELGCMLALSLVVGSALGGLAARLVYERVDLLPNIPPHPLLRIPLAALLPVTILIAVATMAGALRAHRTADRANVAEVLRSGA